MTQPPLEISQATLLLVVAEAATSIAEKSGIKVNLISLYTTDECLNHLALAAGHIRVAIEHQTKREILITKTR